MAAGINPSVCQAKQFEEQGAYANVLGTKGASKMSNVGLWVIDENDKPEPESLTVPEIVEAWLKANGYNGLKRPEGDVTCCCRCGDDLMGYNMCGLECGHCRAAVIEETIVDTNNET